MTETSANRAIGRLIAAFPNRDWSDLAVTEYVRALTPEDPDVLEGAVTLLVSSEEWPPSIAKVLAACASIRIERRRNGLDRNDLRDCPKCDHGWQARGADVVPCPRCQPETWQRWSKGDFRLHVVQRSETTPIPDELKQLREHLTSPRPKTVA